MQKEHTHPFTILRNLWRVFYLVIIPVVRGFISALQGGLGKWVQGAWVDILIFMFMITVAVARWYFTTYEYDKKAIHVYSRFPVYRHTAVDWSRVNTLTVIYPFFLRPVKGANLRVDTLGGRQSNIDLNLYIHRETAQRIMANFHSKEPPNPNQIYMPTFFSILVLALFSSNMLTGILYIAAFISQSGKLFGRGFSNIIIYTFEEATRQLAFGISPAAAAIGYVLLAGWFIGVISICVRYTRFSIMRCHNILDIAGGLFTVRDYAINYNEINFLDIQQSVFTKMLKIHSMYISVVGYGKHKDDISCIIPSLPQNEFEQQRKKLFPNLPLSSKELVPGWRGISHYLFDPLVPCCVFPIAMAICLYLFPGWNSFIWFVGLMAIAPSLLFLAVRIVDYKTAGIAKEEDSYALYYSKGFILHAIIIPKDRLSGICLQQNFFQKFGKTCDLILYTTAESRKTHKCRSLNKQEVLQFFNLEKNS